MMHLYKLRLTLLSLLFFTGPSDALESCQPAGSAEISKQVQSHGRDPASVVKQATRVLHNQFQQRQRAETNEIFKNPGDLRIQMSTIYSYFSLSDWTSRLAQIPKARKLDALKSSELDYIFTHWLRSRYLSTVRELVRDRELFRAFREPNFSANEKKQIVNKPAQLVVTDYSAFACANHWDQKSYDCNKSYVFVHTQLSPKALCENKNLAKQSRFKFLVDVTAQPFKIIDVESNGKRIYQDAFVDLSHLFTGNKKVESIFKSLQLWSYSETGPTPKRKLQAFQQRLFQGENMPSTSSSSNRIPAGETKNNKRSN